MSTPYNLYKIMDLKNGDHLCCLYETEEEHRALLTPFLHQGLEQNHKVFYIVDAHTIQNIFNYLREDGVEVEPYLKNGQFSILTVNDTYMKDGVFDPDKMIDLLKKETDEALAEGYSTLRVTGEMSWALQNLPGSERLIEYESKLNKFLQTNKCIAICQYDMRKFDNELLLNVLITHPIAIIGTEIYQNFYYMPPNEFLGNNLPATTFRRCLMNLKERKIAEEKLIESENNYRNAFNRTEFYKDLISHDINNILQAILLNAELGISKLTDTEKLKKFLNIIQDQVKRAANLISNVQKISKLELTKPHLKSVELCEILKNAMDFIKEIYQEKKINIKQDLPREKLFVKANEFLIDVFENIFHNAIKYNQNQVIEILIRISKLQKNGINYLKIECIDNGMGIPDFRKEAIFQRFFQKDKSVSGMGLGLSLVKKIITNYNGEIWVQDKVQGDYSKGSNFTILIPEV